MQLFITLTLAELRDAMYNSGSLDTHIKGMPTAPRVQLSTGRWLQRWRR